MKTVAIFLALVLAFAPLGMAYFTPDDGNVGGVLKIVPAASTAIASGAAAGSIKIISNADAAGNCASDGTGSAGTTQVVCVSNGTNWIAL